MGIRDLYLGDETVACVVPKPGTRFDEEGLLRFCEQILEQFKTPTKLYDEEETLVSQAARMRASKPAQNWI